MNGSASQATGWGPMYTHYAQRPPSGGGRCRRAADCNCASALAVRPAEKLQRAFDAEISAGHDLMITEAGSAAGILQDVAHR